MLLREMGQEIKAFAANPANYITENYHEQLAQADALELAGHLEEADRLRVRVALENQSMLMGAGGLVASLPRLAKSIVTSRSNLEGAGDFSSNEVPDSGAATNSQLSPIELDFDNRTRRWTTFAGLDYGPGSVHGNRVKHVLDHVAPNPNKTTHSVFSVDRNQVLALIDEAWKARGTPLSDDPGAYVIPMGRVIGTEGEACVKIIVRPRTNQIITAYPMR